jgi:hypothetical protein
MPPVGAASPAIVDTFTGTRASSRRCSCAAVARAPVEKCGSAGALRINDCALAERQNGILDRGMKQQATCRFAMRKTIDAAEVWDRLPRDLRQRLVRLVDDEARAAQLLALLTRAAATIRELERDPRALLAGDDDP